MSSKYYQEIECKNCNNIFEVLKSRNRKFCSKSCSATYNNKRRKQTEETKRKISKSVKNYINKNGKFGGQITKENGSVKNGWYKECPICEYDFYVTDSGKDQIYCSYKCFVNDEKKEFCKPIGGFRKNSGQGKQGYYKNMYLHSSWELAYVLYCEDHNIKLKRNKEGFVYTYKNTKHKYYPDFIKENGTYVEVKGYWNKKNREKVKQFPHDIEIIDKESINPYLDYVKNKYGEDFIKLYES